MPNEATTTTVNEVKTASDGTVKIAVEKYNELLERANKPPVINKTIINKTTEMLAQENRAWGITFMAFGGVLFAVGAFRYNAGKS